MKTRGTRLLALVIAAAMAVMPAASVFGAESKYNQNVDTVSHNEEDFISSTDNKSSMSDITGPVVESLSVDITELSVGETVTFTMTATDESGILNESGYPELFLQSKGSSVYKVIHMTEEEDGSYIGEFTVDENTKSGVCYC